MSWGKSVWAIAMLLLFPSWLGAQPRKLEPVKIGYSGVGIAHDLLKIMGSKSIFQKYGLDAQSIYIGSGSLMNQAVVAGNIQFTTSDLPSQIQSTLAGIDFKIISVTIDRLDGAFMARKEIQAPQNLRNKKIAISRFGSVSEIVTRMVLKHWGLEPKDVILMQVGNTPTRIAAILSGQVDAGLINPTDVQRMVAAGCCTVLADLSSLDIPYARFGVAALGSYLRANADTAGRVLEAFTDGIHYYKTHPQDGIAALRSRGGDPQTAGEVYQKVADSYRARPDPDLVSIKGVLDSLPDERVKTIRPETLIDPVPWSKVEKSGLLERLYGKNSSSGK